jgi:acetolactate synthase I/II/III large subunit
MTQTAGQFIAQVLHQEGLDRMFVLTGGDHHLWIALDNVGVTPMLARSEASAIYMADGYAQRTGMVGVSYGQGGPGAANVAGALADPYWSRTPLLTLNGSNPESSNYRNQYQDLDTEPMLEAVTSSTFRISSAAQLVTLLPRAIALARLYGPVNISIPRDLFGKDVGEVAWPITIPDLAGVPTPDPTAIAQAAEAIRGMRRPLVLAGTGAKRARVGDQALALAERLGTTVATSAGGKGIISEDHELATGVIGRYAGKAAVSTAEEADGLVVLGSRLGGLVTDGYRFPPAGGQIVQLDRDPASLVAHPGPGVRVQTDLARGLTALLEALSDHEPSSETREWQRAAIDRRVQWREHVAGLPIYGSEGQLRPHAVFPILNARADRITLVADTGYMAAWACALFGVRDPDGFFRANGSLGWGYPAALGVQAADLARRVVCLSGDGGIGYHMGDFETAIRLKLPVIVVVLNNRGLAFEYHGQKYKYDNQIVPSVNDLTDLDHSAVARGFGWQGRRVKTIEEFEASLDEALTEGGQPWMIDVVIDREDFAPITNYDSLLERDI